MKKQGEVWRFEIDDDEREGSQQEGDRYALVLQNDQANKRLDSTLIALITGREPWEKAETGIGPEECHGLRKQSAIKLHQIMTVDHEDSGFGRRVGEAPDSVMKSAKLALKSDVL